MHAALITTSLLWVSAIGPATAQNAAQPNTAANWRSECSTSGRNDPLSCRVEQVIIVQETRQQLARVSIQTTAGDEGLGSVLLHVPLGLSIVEGLNLRVDQTKAISIPIQTCDAAGCYGGYALDDTLLASMQSGGTMALTFLNLQKKPITANFTLSGFSAAYAKIK